MLFSSITFLIYFLPCMVLVYFLAPGRMKNTVLLLGSLIFYGWGEPKYLPVMAAVILAGYLSARLIGTCQNKRQSKILLAAAVLLEIFPLIYCKYADFFIQNLNVLTGQKIPLLSIAMPLGISFYTFQVISYTVDVYRGDVPAQKNLLTFAAYVAMFPQLVAGPIVRYSDIRSQLENRTHSVEKCAYGIRRFVTGLSKKILIANVLGELIGQFQASEEKSVLFFWMYAVALCFRFTLIFPGTAIWRSDWELFLDLISGKLPLSLLFCEHYRILAQMAYFTWRMVPGLSLHPAGRQSCKTCAVDLQYFSCVDGNRILAWGGMEFYPVGTNVCGAFTD